MLVSKKDGKNIQKKKKNAQNDKTIINTIYMTPDFPIIKKDAKKL